jgi:hypothetical protein
LVSDPFVKVTLQISDGALQTFDRVLELAEAPITETAHQSAHPARLVVVVNVERIVFADTPALLTANCTAPTLVTIHFVVGFNRQAIGVFQFSAPLDDTLFGDVLPSPNGDLVRRARFAPRLPSVARLLLLPELAQRFALSTKPTPFHFR